MLAIIGTYRGLSYVPRLLDSLDAHTKGISEIVFVNDSPNEVVSDQLLALGRGKVLNVGGQGYNTAMKAVCGVGALNKDHAIFLEEDFYITGDVDFAAYAGHLDASPYLAQIVLQRQPWFENELRAGGMLKALKLRGQKFEGKNTLLEHTAFFSGNPAVWRIETFESGWPDGEWSENAKRDQLISQGYKFAITPEILCHHDGVRSGKDY